MSRPHGKRRPVLIASFAAIILLALCAAAFTLRTIEHQASGNHSESFIVDCDYDKFRQIMVRKNATRAIIEQGGMTLLDEQIHDVKLDLSDDRRPLLNALRGQSKSELDAVKQLTVNFHDPSIHADKVKLRQVAEVTPDHISVSTASIAPTGNLENYVTTLEAEPSNDGTEVTLSVSLDVLVEVPKLFTRRADAKVQTAAEDAVAEQAASIRSFIAQHADKRLILPEL